MEGMELISFQIISAVGSAKSLYIEAIQKAKENQFEQAEELIREGERAFVKGHHAHAELIQKEANGDKIDFSLLIMHAEDQLMSAETIKLMADEFIAMYRSRK